MTEMYVEMYSEFLDLLVLLIRDSLYNKLQEFGFPQKIISLTRMSMDNEPHTVPSKVDNTLSDEFDVLTELKQGYALSPLFFNIAEYPLKK